MPKKTIVIRQQITKTTKKLTSFSKDCEINIATLIYKNI